MTDLEAINLEVNIVCCTHELSLRYYFIQKDGDTTGLSSFTGPIGKVVTLANKKPGKVYHDGLMKLGTNCLRLYVSQRKPSKCLKDI